MKVGVIYKLQFPNNKVYIGKTINLTKRIREHRDLYKRENYTEYHSKVYKAIRKYGWDNIIVSLVEDNIPEDLLNIKECEWIQGFNSYKNGYNSTLGGEGSPLSKEHREKISKSQLGEKNHNFGKKASTETKQKMSLAKKGKKHNLFGKHHSQQSKLKNSLSHKGRVHSEEAKKKMSEARKKYLAGGK